MTRPSQGYAIKSAKIVYHFNNLMQEGTKTMTFDDSGRYVKIIVEAHLIVAKAGFASIDTDLAKSIRQSLHQMSIRTPEMRYTVDMDSLVGYRQPLGPVTNPADFFGSPKVVGKDTILGRPCIVKEIGGFVRVWSWEGIDLRTETISDGGGSKTQEIAVSIDERYGIKPDEFEIPKNVKLMSQ